MTDESQPFWEALGGKTWGEIGGEDDQPYVDPVSEFINEMKADIETLKARVAELEGRPLAVEHDLCTLGEAQKVFRCSGETLRRWIRNDQIRAVFVPGGLRIPRDEVERFLSN